MLPLFPKLGNPKSLTIRSIALYRCLTEEVSLVCQGYTVVSGESVGRTNEEVDVKVFVFVILFLIFSVLLWAFLGHFDPFGINFLERNGVEGYISLFIVSFLLSLVVARPFRRKRQRRLTNMQEPDISEMEFQLRKLFSRYSELLAYHQWPSEHDRWVELIFALVSRIVDMPELEVRDVIKDLDDLDLLDIGRLSEIPEARDGVDLDFPHARRIFESLSESGFTQEDSESSVLVMHEAAKSVGKNHDGKIQKYLRKYGQRMMDELSQSFSFSKMDEADVRYAFTYWLQNVLNMPVSLEDESIEEFCDELDRTPEELMQAADKMDINLATIDDMVQMYLMDQMPAEEIDE